ncbi:MAG: protein phosphatase 2C domain-containing protein [Helicobacteraceae bacterium]|jgi:serine/threonine protein phosphatase PrpC|nr:protein phosphatase 2C domain-containing protein [Helicobacteraceae bacterium]
MGDTLFSILRLTENQISLLANDKVSDNELYEFVKRPEAINAATAFKGSIASEWKQYKEEANMNNTKADAIRQYAENQGSSETANDTLKKIDAANTTKEPYKRVQFKLPNAKKGEKYEGKITAVETPNVTVTDVTIKDDNLGLKFDPQTQTISGIAQKSGEFTFDLRYKISLNETRTEKVFLLINKDSWEMWQEIEPDKNLPHPKAHSDRKKITQNESGVYIAAASKRGRSHAHVGSFRDDDFFIDCCDDWSVLVVADGAGSAKLSRVGSKEASNAAGKTLSKKLKEDGDKLTELIKPWDGTTKQDKINSIVSAAFWEAVTRAINSVESESKSNNAQPRDLATTLLAAIAKRINGRVFIAAFWVGDGVIAAYSGNDKEKIRILGKPDEGEYAGQTRFLDRAIVNDFASRMKVGFFADIKAIVLTTDGVSDPMFENGLKDSAKWDELWSAITPALQNENPDEKLLEWLDFKARGYHDDRTIVVQWFEA